MSIRGQARRTARLLRRFTAAGPLTAPRRFAHHGRVVIGIRREDPLRVWERRCPLTPAAVEQLVQEEDVEILVQPCERRVFTMDEFLKAGAKPHNDLSPAHIVIGIKETPMNELLLDPVPAATDGPAHQSGKTASVARTHLMFSHTIKGQAYNMPLLARFLGSQGSDLKESSPKLLPTLIDWELLTDSKGKRSVGFGWYAGVAGALEGLVSTAHLHLDLGVASPFLSTPRPHTALLPALKSSMREIGGIISSTGTPKSMGPFVICVTGAGQVAQGVLALLSELPVQMISPAELPSLVEDPYTPLNKIYVVHATQEKYLTNRHGGIVSREDYYSNPSSYESKFHETIAPYMTLLINGVGWNHGFPRLMTNDQIVEALRSVKLIRQRLLGATERSTLQDTTGIVRDVMKGRCQSFADVSCDIEGGLEFVPRSSTLSAPFFSYKPTNFLHDLPSLQIMSVDILPTSLPLDSSETFSSGVLPYIKALVGRYRRSAFFSSEALSDSLDEALQRATVTSAGRLVGSNTWLQEVVGSVADKDKSVQISQNPSAKKRVLMLGSGMVAGPAVERLCQRKDVQLVLASDQATRSQLLCSKHENAEAVTIDMNATAAVESLIRNTDIVISLLPVPFHPAVAELCIKHGRHLVTASYISPAMNALHDRAVQSGAVLLNEIGLDPGIDHCSALSLLDSLQRQNKKVLSFTSFCGGLPSPECADGPLRYKFSWSPRGVLNAALNGARFLLNSQELDVSSENLLQCSIPQLPVSNTLQLEGLPNRDSVSYGAIYGLQDSHDLRTLFRGTIRYPGFSSLLYAFRRIGLLETKRSIILRSWATLAQQSLEASLGLSIKDEESFNAAITDLIPRANVFEVRDALRWLSSPSECGRLSPPPSSALPPIDLLASFLSQKLAYKPNEKDLVLLHHEIISEAPRTGHQEIHAASLEVYGNSEHSAMALCVGLPVAMSALRVLDGDFDVPGVRGPTAPKLYEPLLDELSEAGLQMRHTVRPYEAGVGVEARLRQVWSPAD